MRDVFGETDRDVTQEDLPRLIYLEAVIKESMRVYPAVPAVTRNIKEDVKLSELFFSTYLIKSINLEITSEAFIVKIFSIFAATS